MDSATERELNRRLTIWSMLKERVGPDAVRPKLVIELRIHRGQQGVIRDLELTRNVSGGGESIKVGLLQTVSTHADDLSDDGINYHYPDRGLRDENVIRATRACGNLGLPLFVVITPEPGSTERNVRLGWVNDYDGSGLIL